MEYLKHILGEYPRPIDIPYIDYLLLAVSDSYNCCVPYADDEDVVDTKRSKCRMEKLKNYMETLEHLLQLGGNVNHVFWPQYTPCTSFTPWTAFLSAALRSSLMGIQQDSLPLALGYMNALPYYLKAGANMSTKIALQDQWTGDRRLWFSGHRYDLTARTNLQQCLKGYTWRGVTIATAQQDSLQEPSTRKIEDRAVGGDYPLHTVSESEDRTSYLVWYEVNAAFALQHFQRFAALKGSPFDFLDGSHADLAHREPLCICVPAMNVAGILSPEDARTLVAAYGEIGKDTMANKVDFLHHYDYLNAPSCYQKVQEIFQRSKKVDMCQYLLSKGYIKHPDDPEILREAPPMFRESSEESTGVSGTSAVPDVGDARREGEDRINEDVVESDLDIRPLQKRTTDLSIYCDALEYLPEEVS